jgi:hypothetical protein
VFAIGGCVVSLKATLGHVVCKSTIEAKYMAIAKACKEPVWLKVLYVGLCIDDSWVNFL